MSAKPQSSKTRGAHSLGALVAGVTGMGAGLLATIGLLHLRRSDSHFVRTSEGWARIHTVRDETGTPVRVLELGGAYESATYLDGRRNTPVFAYQQAFDQVFEADLQEPGLPNHNLLMIGGGGYAWPKHAIATALDEAATSAFPIPFDLSLDVVEIDPAITAIAREHFFLDQLFSDYPAALDRLHLICADGRAFLKSKAHAAEVTAKAATRSVAGSTMDAATGSTPAPNSGYGAIINDTFAGKTPVMSLASVEAMRLVKRCLAPGGVYATNVVSEQEGADIAFLRQVVTTLTQVFDQVTIVPCEDADFGLEDNYLVLASDVDHGFSGALPFDEDFLSTPIHDA